MQLHASCMIYHDAAPVLNRLPMNYGGCGQTCSSAEILTGHRYTFGRTSQLLSSHAHLNSD